MSRGLAKCTSLNATCAPIEGSDQPARPRSPIRIFDCRSVDGQGPTFLLEQNTDCADAKTDLTLPCANMPTCTLCWVSAR